MYGTILWVALFVIYKVEYNWNVDCVEEEYCNNWTCGKCKPLQYVWYPFVSNTLVLVQCKIITSQIETGRRIIHRGNLPTYNYSIVDNTLVKSALCGNFTRHGDLTSAVNRRCVTFRHKKDVSSTGSPQFCVQLWCFAIPFSSQHYHYAALNRDLT